MDSRVQCSGRTSHRSRRYQQGPRTNVRSIDLRYDRDYPEREFSRRTQPDRSRRGLYDEEERRFFPQRRSARDLTYREPISNMAPPQQQVGRPVRPPMDDWWREPDPPPAREPPHRVTITPNETEDFTTCVRIMYKVIKMTHLQNVSQDPEPRMLRKMVDSLSTFIKPVLPPTKTADLVPRNAKNWGHTSLLILRHYMEQIENLLPELTSFSSLNWQEPFRVAANRARRDLGRRLLPDSVRKAETTLQENVYNNHNQNGVQDGILTLLEQELRKVVATQTETLTAPTPPPPLPPSHVPPFHAQSGGSGCPSSGDSPLTCPLDRKTRLRNSQAPLHLTKRHFRLNSGGVSVCLAPFTALLPGPDGFPPGPK